MLYSNLINMQGLNSSGIKQIASFKSEKSFLQEVQSISEVKQGAVKGSRPAASRTFSVNIQPADQIDEHLKGKTSKHDADFLMKINKLGENKSLAICKKDQQVSVIDDNGEQVVSSNDKIAYESASQLLQLAGLFNSGDKLIVHGSYVERVFNLSHEVQNKPLAKSIMIENDKNEKDLSVITIKPLLDNKNKKSVLADNDLSQTGNKLPIPRERVEVSESDLRVLFHLASQVVKDLNGSIQISKLAETVCVSDNQNNNSKLYSDSKLIDSLITKVGDVFKGKSDGKELGVMIKTMVGVVNRIYELQSQPKLAGISLTYKDEDILIARKISSSKPVSLVSQGEKSDKPGELPVVSSKKVAADKSLSTNNVEDIIEQIHQDFNIPSNLNTSRESFLEKLPVTKKSWSNDADTILKNNKQINLQPGIAESILRNGREFYYVSDNLNPNQTEKSADSKLNTVRHLIRDESELRSITKKTIAQILKVEEKGVTPLKNNSSDNNLSVKKINANPVDLQNINTPIKSDLANPLKGAINEVNTMAVKRDVTVEDQILVHNNPVLSKPAKDQIINNNSLDLKQTVQANLNIGNEQVSEKKKISGSKSNNIEKKEFAFDALLQENKDSIETVVKLRQGSNNKIKAGVDNPVRIVSSDSPIDSSLFKPEPVTINHQDMASKIDQKSNNIIDKAENKVAKIVVKETISSVFPQKNDFPGDNRSVIGRVINKPETEIKVEEMDKINIRSLPKKDPKTSETVTSKAFVDKNDSVNQTVEESKRPLSRKIDSEIVKQQPNVQSSNVDKKRTVRERDSVSSTLIDSKFNGKVIEQNYAIKYEYVDKIQIQSELKQTKSSSKLSNDKNVVDNSVKKSLNDSSIGKPQKTNLVSEERKSNSDRFIHVETNESKDKFISSNYDFKGKKADVVSLQDKSDGSPGNSSIADQIDEYINEKKRAYSKNLQVAKNSDKINTQSEIVVSTISDNSFLFKDSEIARQSLGTNGSNVNDLEALQKRLMIALSRSILDLPNSNEDRNRLIVQINPDSMGVIKIDVLNKDRVLDLRFEISDPATKKMIELEQEKLKESMMDKGFQISSFHIADSADSNEDVFYDHNTEDPSQSEKETLSDRENQKDKNKEGGNKKNAYQFSFSFVNLLEDSNHLSKDLIGFL